MVDPKDFKKPSPREIAGRFFEKPLSGYGMTVPGHLEGMTDKSTLSDALDKFLIPIEKKELTTCTEIGDEQEIGISQSKINLLKKLRQEFDKALAGEDLNTSVLQKSAGQLEKNYLWAIGSFRMFNSGRAQQADGHAAMMSSLSREIFGKEAKLTRASMEAAGRMVVRVTDETRFNVLVTAAIYALVTELAATKGLPLPSLPPLDEKEATPSRG